MKLLVRRTFVTIDRVYRSCKHSLTQIMPSTTIDVSYSNGPQGDCGIACVDMVLKTYGKQLDKDWTKYRNEETYIEDIGWKHSGLKLIIENHSDLGVDIFKYKSLEFVLEKLSKNQLIIASISVPTIDNLSEELLFESIDSSKKLENHMVLCVGYDEENIIINDPRNIGIYTQDLKISKQLFRKKFNGNGLLIKLQNKTK